MSFVRSSLLLVSCLLLAVGGTAQVVFAQTTGESAADADERARRANSAERQNSNPASQAGADAANAARTIAYENAPLLCDVSSGSKLREIMQPNRIFPILPKELLDGELCSISYWNKEIFILFGYKILRFLNWVAGVIAIIATLWAGVLYIAGYISEKNITRAKSMLTTVWGGLVIVLAARYILASTQIITGETNSTTLDKVSEQVLYGTNQ